MMLVTDHTLSGKVAPGPGFTGSAPSFATYLLCDCEEIISPSFACFLSHKMKTVPHRVAIKIK